MGYFGDIAMRKKIGQLYKNQINEKFLECSRRGYLRIFYPFVAGSTPARPTLKNKYLAFIYVIWL